MNRDQQRQIENLKILKLGFIRENYEPLAARASRKNGRMCCKTLSRSSFLEEKSNVMIFLGGFRLTKT